MIWFVSARQICRIAGSRGEVGSGVHVLRRQELVVEGGSGLDIDQAKGANNAGER